MEILTKVVESVYQDIRCLKEFIHDIFFPRETFLCGNMLVNVLHLLLILYGMIFAFGVVYGFEKDQKSTATAFYDKIIHSDFVQKLLECLRKMYQVRN